MLAHSERAIDGFSVIEAIVALGIIATAVVTMAGLAVRTTDMVLRARQRSVAVHLADGMVTELAARGIPAAGPDCLLRDVSGCVEYRDAAGQVAPTAAAGYALRWAATAVPGSPLPATLLTVCAVPDAERAPTPRPAGACATRVVMPPWP